MVFLYRVKSKRLYHPQALSCLGDFLLVTYCEVKFCDVKMRVCGYIIKIRYNYYNENDEVQNSVKYLKTYLII